MKALSVLMFTLFVVNSYGQFHLESISDKKYIDFILYAETQSIKTVNKKYYSFNSDKGILERDSRFDERLIFEHNYDTLIVTEIVSNPNGNIFRIYYFNNNRKLCKIYIKQFPGKPYQNIIMLIMVFNADQLIDSAKLFRVNGDGGKTLITYFIYHYKKKQPIAEEGYDSLGETLYKKRFLYNANNNLIKEEIIHGNGESKSRYTYKYDKMNNIISAKGDYYGELFFTYDFTGQDTIVVRKYKNKICEQCLIESVQFKKNSILNECKYQDGVQTEKYEYELIKGE